MSVGDITPESNSNHTENPADDRVVAPSSGGETLQTTEDTAAADVSPIAHNREADSNREPAPRTCDDVRRGGFTPSVRGRLFPARTAKTFTGADPLAVFIEALKYADHPTPEPVLNRKGTRVACALDCDWHGTAPPDWRDISRVMFACPLPPSRWWVTHGGGLRCLYFRVTHPADGLVIDADEIAALAVVLVRQRRGELTTPFTDIELKCDSRHPGYPKADGSRVEGIWTGPAPGIDALRHAAKRLFRRWDDDDESDPEDIEEKLRRRGLYDSDRFSHAVCPIRPTPGDDKNNAVVVLERGVYCHSCAAKGYTFSGCGKPGRVPFARMSPPGGGGFVGTPVQTMAYRFTRWDHARHVLRHLLGGGKGSAPLRDAALQPAYRALIKSRHLEHALRRRERDEGFDVKAYGAGVDAQLTSAVLASTPIIRVEGGYWTHAGQPEKNISADGRAALVGSLPASQYYDDETRSWKTSKKAHGLLQNNGPVASLGYFPCRIIGRVDLHGLVGDAERAGSAAAPIIVPMDPPFRYLSPSDRGTIAGAPWHTWLTSCFPGINLRALKLAIGAIAHGQLPRTEPIRVAFEGQSGAAKSSTVYLAAELVGVSVVGVPFTRDRDKWLRAYAASQGKVALTDECGKSGVPPTEMQSLILAIRKGEQFHALYAGATPILYPGAHFFADTKFPPLFWDDIQIARRIIGGKLDAGAVGHDWMATSEGGIEGWRTRNELNTHVADCLVSEVTDAIRRHPHFESYAASLDFFPLGTQSAEGHDANAPLYDLFAAAMSVPERRGGRWTGAGWRVVTESQPTQLKGEAVGDGQLVKAVDELRDVNGRLDEQRITGAQWGNLIPISGLSCDIEPHGRKVGIRFRVGPGRGKDTLFGPDVLKGLPANHTLWKRIARAVPGGAVG